MLQRWIRDTAQNGDKIIVWQWMGAALQHALAIQLTKLMYMI